MKKILILSMMLVLGGCSSPYTSTVNTNQLPPSESEFTNSISEIGEELLKDDPATNSTNPATEGFVYPISGYAEQRTKKVFGQYIPVNSGDRFSGYHTGDDIEVLDIAVEAPVYAIKDGLLMRKDTISGYGGVVILEIEDDGETYHVLYGHVDIASVPFAIGDSVSAGQEIAQLGDDQSQETDGERKHLHFAIYPYEIGSGVERITGYTNKESDLALWTNPYDFLRERNATAPAEINTEDITSAIKNTVK